MCCQPRGASRCRLRSLPQPRPRAHARHLPSTLVRKCCSRNLASRGCLRFPHPLPHPQTCQRSHQSQGTGFWLSFFVPGHPNQNFKSKIKGPKLALFSCFLIQYRICSWPVSAKYLVCKMHLLEYARLRSKILIVSDVLLHLNDRLSNKQSNPLI